MTYDAQRPWIMKAHRRAMHPWWARHFFPATMLWLSAGFVVIAVIGLVALWCGVAGCR